MAQGRKTRRNLALLGGGVGALGLLGAFGDSGGSSLAINEEELSQPLREAQESFSPYSDAGGAALQRLSGILQGDTGTEDILSQIPGYQARQRAIQQGVERSAAARGMLRSGGTLRALAREQGAYAGQAFQGYLANLGSVAQMGQRALGQQADLAGGIADIGLQAQEARMAQQRLQQQREQQRSSGFGQLLGGGLGFLAGGPAGAYAGSQIGGGIGGLL